MPGAARDDRLTIRNPYSAVAVGGAKFSVGTLLPDAGPAVDADERRPLLRRIEVRRKRDLPVQPRLAVRRQIGELLGPPTPERVELRRVASRSARRATGRRQRDRSAARRAGMRHRHELRRRRRVVRLIGIDEVACCPATIATRVVNAGSVSRTSPRPSRPTRCSWLFMWLSPSRAM